MKRIFLFIALLVMSGIVFAEEPFKIIVIPIVDNVMIGSSETFSVAQHLQIDTSIGEIKQAVSEKIAQLICSPRYIKVDMIDISNEQNINALPAKDFMMKAVKDSGADGMLVFEITRIDFARYNVEEITKANCVVSCHVRTYNGKTGSYVNEKFINVGEPYKRNNVSVNQLHKILISSVNGALEQIFGRLPE